MLKATDRKIYDLIKKEQKRQAESIRLIPSENYVSKSVLEATGSILTNKYSEGYSRKRYYEGQEYIDQIEEEAVARAKKLFRADHVNVQPYSGSPANLAVYFALLKPSEKIMGMSLPHGGHLTHGWKVSATAKFFNAVQYAVDKKTNLLDYDEILEIAKREKPQIIVAGATAYPRKIDFKKFKEIADEVGAYFLADIAHISGLVAAGLHQSPVPYADVVTTTTHKSLRGPRGAMIMCKEKHAKLIDKAVFPGLQGGPHDNTTAAIAVALKEADTSKFKNYAKQIIKNAQALAKELLNYNFDLVTGGTDNHLILIDMTNKNLSGKQMSSALIKAGIECNANTVPYDKRSPFDPSGIRIGTPAITTLGMKEKEMKQIAFWMNEVSENVNNERVLKRIKNEVKKLCGKYEMPGLK
ncbi:MAG: serine hydroxymethyltransferase [Patescibacteria group bacterium]|nr:serine hydroxymethyltransferase [Patescibacteria group bacterium]